MRMQQLTLGMLLLLSTITAAQAQTKAGTVLLGGSVNYNTYNSESKTVGSIPIASPASVDEQRNLIFSPRAGFFVADNLVIGLSSEIISNKQVYSQPGYDPATGATGAYTTTRKNRGLRIGPFVRYYNMVGEKLGFYGQLAGGYSGGNENYDSGYPGAVIQKRTFTGGYAAFTPGLVFFPTQKIGLELTLGDLTYYKSTSESEDLPNGQSGRETRSSSFGANIGMQYLTAGIAFHLGK